MKVFISGSIGIKKIPIVAQEKIESIINKGFFVLIGDAKGVDSVVQKYLCEKNYKDVLVYFAGNEIRNNFGQWNTKQVMSMNNEKGRDLYTLKDIEMAKDTDYGLMIWDGKSDGTLNNIITMNKMRKRFFVTIEEMIFDDTNIEDLLLIQKEQLQRSTKQNELF